MYIGQNSLWDFYRQYGAVGPISGLAHEYGHFLQAFAGVPDPTTATETIRHEDQADCVSGAFINYLDDRGVVEYPEDFDNVGQYLTATAFAEGPGRDHGTADERTRSFELGYTRCSAGVQSVLPRDAVGHVGRRAGQPRRAV